MRVAFVDGDGDGEGDEPDPAPDPLVGAVDPRFVVGREPDLGDGGELEEFPVERP